MVKNLPVMHEVWVLSLGWEEPLDSMLTKFCFLSIIQGFPGGSTVKNLPAMGEIGFDSWVGKIPWRRDRLSIPVFLGFPGGSDNKEPT